MLTSSDICKSHLAFWISESLDIFKSDQRFVQPSQNLNGTMLQYDSNVFSHTKYLLLEALECKRIKPSQLSNVSTKSLYESLTETMPPPAVEFLYENREWVLVWKRLHNGVITQSARDTLFFIIHEKFYTRERGHRLMPGRIEDSLCTRCFMKTDTISHKFLYCSHSSESWGLARELIESVQPLCTTESDHSLLNLYFSPFLNENTIQWIIGEFIDFIMNESIESNTKSTRNNLANYLKNRGVEC